MNIPGRPFPPDQPQTVTVRCSPIDFEAARDQLALHGYAITSTSTERGKLVITATRKVCGCDLCREAGQ